MSNHSCIGSVQQIPWLQNAPIFGEPWDCFRNSWSAGLAVLDEQLRFVTINDLLAKMRRIPPEAYTGKTVHEIMGQAAEHVETIVRRVLKEGLSLTNEDSKIFARGEAAHWLEYYLPLRDTTGQVKWVGVVIVDPTRREAVDTLLHSSVRAVERERSRTEALRDFNKLMATVSLHHFVAHAPQIMRKVVPHDLGVLVFSDESIDTFGAMGLGFELDSAIVDRQSATALRELFANPVVEARILDRQGIAECGPCLQALFLQNDLRQLCCVPIAAHERWLGVLILGSRNDNAFSDDQCEVAKLLGGYLAFTFDSLSQRNVLQRERAKLQALQQVSLALARGADSAAQWGAIAESVRNVVPYDHASIAVLDHQAEALMICSLPDAGLKAKSLLSQIHRSTRVASPARTRIFSGHDTHSEESEYVRYLLAQGAQSLCCVPLITRNGTLGTLNLSSFQEDAFQAGTVSLLEQMAGQVAMALDNATAYHEIEQLKQRLAQENISLREGKEERRSETEFANIVGDSPALKRVLTQVQIASPSDATVLILGETGTGKELIARAIHSLSARRHHAVVKVNCAAIPTGLLESELFGHEKGAFTGAISQKIGRLEIADKGTLFLDEVGDLPLELQPKLLRVLQDQEFERLGGTRTIRVNIRLVAATNSNLQLAMEQNRFRSDLFYRLKVFPVTVPPLRERKTDIPSLVRYFVAKFAQRMHRNIETISCKTMDILQEWDWPGNVRELENFIERSVILSEGTVLDAPIAELSHSDPPASTLEDMDRDRITQILRETRGIIGGSNGAAARLGMKRTTLQSKITRLGIIRQDYQS